MAIGRPIGAVLALWTRQSVDLAPHQLLEDFEADRGRGGEKALAHVRREGGQMSFQAIGQLDRQRMDQLCRSAANSTTGGLLRTRRDVRGWHGFLQCDFQVSQSVTLHASGWRTLPQLKFHGTRDNLLLVGALGIDSEGRKVPLGVVEGTTENAAVVSSLLADLRDRGLDVSEGVLFVVDGGTAIGSAIRSFFGRGVAVHRCHRHKERNVLEHLPEIERPLVQRRLRAAWAESDPAVAKAALEALAAVSPITGPVPRRRFGKGCPTRSP